MRLLRHNRGRERGAGTGAGAAKAQINATWLGNGARLWRGRGRGCAAGGEWSHTWMMRIVSRTGEAAAAAAIAQIKG